MDSTKLKYFVSAAHRLNFSEVAKLFFISQPTVSHQIDLLEQELGVKLFYRNGKRLELTSEGAYFLPLAEKLLESERDAVRRVRQYSMGMEGKLRIFVSETSLGLYRRCLEAFYQKYNKIAIDTVCAGTVEQSEILLRGGCDLYFVLEDLVRNNQEFGYMTTLEDTLCLVVPRDVRIADPKDFASLGDLPFVGLNIAVSTHLQEDIEAIMKARNYTPRIVNTYNMIEELLLSVELGIGFTIAPYSITQESRYNVKCYPLDDICGSVNRVIAWQRSNHNRATELFLDVVRELLK